MGFWIRGFYAYFATFWNMLSFVSYALLICTISFEFNEGHTGRARNIAAVGTLLVWLHTLYYLLGFRSFGALVRMILEILGDMRCFLLVMCLFSICFSQVYYILLNENVYAYDQPVDILWSIFNTAWLGAQWTDFSFDVVQRIMYVIMCLFQLILLLNLLIAIMGDTFGKVKENEIVQFYYNFATLIYELEVLMSEEERTSQKYFPSYLLFSVKEGDIAGGGQEPAAANPEDSSSTCDTL